MPEIIIDEELGLASPTLDNAEELHAAVRGNLPHLKPWVLWATDDYDLGGVREFINGLQKRIKEDKSLEFSIFYRGQIVGGIGFITLGAQVGNAEIGYWIDADHEGKGIVTRCLKAMIEYAFDKLHFTEVYLRIAASNARSRAVAERNGFVVTSITPGAHQLPGRMDDLVIYSLNKNDRLAGV